MASKYTFRGVADMTQHDKSIQKSASEVYKYEKKVSNAQKELNNFQKSITESVGSLKNLGAAFSNGSISDFSGSLLKLVPTLGTATAGVAGLGVAINTALGPVGLITAAIGAIGGIAVGAGKSFAEFETHLDSLQSLTGLDDGAMKDISKSAIDMSKDFKASAGDIVDSMKLIGSQAPELLKDKDALGEVTKSANVLAEAAQIEVVDAAKAITTTMNQMGVSAAESSNIINTLAAASQQGSADVAYLNTAFEKAGTAANSAGMNYTQLAAAVETIAPKFSSAEVAGSKLSSTLLALSVQGNNNFKPSVVGMSEALKNLAKAEMTDAELKQLVGASNIDLIKSLIQGQETFDSYSQSLAGTSTAFEQMETNNDNLQGAMTKLKSAWDAFLLTLGESAIIQGAISLLQEVIKFINDIINSISNCLNEMTSLDAGIDIIDLLTAQLKICAATFKALMEVVNVAISFIVKLFNTLVNQIKSDWNRVKQTLSDLGIFEPFRKGCMKLIEWFNTMIAKLKKAWTDFKKWLGMNVAETKVTAPSTQLSPTTTNTPTATSTPTVNKPTKATGGKTKAIKQTVKVEADKGSIKELENRLSKLNEELNTKNVSTERVEQIKKEKAALEDQIKKLKERNGLLDNPEIGSIKELENRLSKINDELNNKNVSTDRLSELSQERTELERQIKVLKERNGLLETKQTAKNGSLQDVQSKLSEAKSKLNLEVQGTKEYDELAKKVAELTQQEHKLKIEVDKDTLTEDEQKLLALEEQIKRVKETEDLIESLGNAFSSIGDAIDGATGKFISWAAASFESIAKLIPQIQAVVLGKQAEALASGTAEGAKMPFPANLAAIATIVATIAGIFASLPKFAGGGITTVGDFNLARVNGNEMILNPRQQRTLFNALDKNNIQDNNTVSFGEVKIKGSDLYIALKNYGQIQNKIGKNIGIK